MWNGASVSSECLGYQVPDEYKFRIAGDGLVISRPEGDLQVPLASRAAASAAGALSRLGRGEVIAELQLMDSVMAGGGDWGVEAPKFLQYLARLGTLQRVLASDAGPLAIVEPISSSYELKEAAEPAQNSRLRLSRFSYLHADSGVTVLESPLCHARVRVLDSRIAALLVRLSRPESMDDLLRNDPAALNGFLRPAVALFLTEGFLASVAASGEAEVDDTRALRQWEFHDLLFHTRSRLGRHSNPIGGTFRFYGELEPLPPVKPPMSQVKLPLVRPDLMRTALQDMPLTTALEHRASVRSYNPSPITLAEVGEFLFRTARVRARTMVSEVVEVTSRPYPNGGASYELEIYPIVDRCQDLLPGFYHYEPQEHALEPLTQPNALTEQFLKDAWVFSGQSARPEILIMITARFGRVSWKYASIAYATILKNVGALYQTMYLVATAMRLAPVRWEPGTPIVSVNCSERTTTEKQRR